MKKLSYCLLISCSLMVLPLTATIFDELLKKEATTLVFKIIPGKTDQDGMPSFERCVDLIKDLDESDKQKLNAGNFHFNSEDIDGFKRNLVIIDQDLEKRSQVTNAGLKMTLMLKANNLLIELDQEEYGDTDKQVAELFGD